MKTIPILYIILLFCSNAYAQDSTRSSNYKYNNYYDLAVAVGKDELLAAASWSHLYGIGHKKQKFKIGYGLRFTSFYGYSEGKLYTTAPSKYTSPEQGPTTIFSENIDGNIDTLSISNPQVNSLNASIHLQYSITKKIDIGFNIDAIGFSFGTTKNGSVISSVYDPGQAYVQPARPTAFNLLLTSDNDFGSLNSEFYLRYWLTGHLGIRAGYTFYFSEYTTVNTLSFDNGQIQNDRYRLKSSLLMLAITYRPFVKH